MTVQPPLLDVLGARWALGAAAVAAAWSGGTAAFALADGTVALAPAPWPGAPSLRRREGGGVEVVPARGSPPPLSRASVSRGPCRALVATAGGFFTGGADGRLRRLGPDGSAERVAKFGAAVDAVAAAGDGWACIAGGRVHGGPAAGGCDPPGAAAGLAWHGAAGLAVAHEGGVAVCRGTGAESLPGGAPGGAVVAFSPDGRWLAGPALWRLSPLARVALPGASGPPAAVAFSAGGDWLALAGSDGVRLWRLTADGAGEAVPAPGGWRPGGVAATALAFHPRRPLLAAAYANGAVLLGPPDGGDALLLRAGAAGDGVGALAFEPGGAWLAIGTAAGECAVVALPDSLFRTGETRPATRGREGGGTENGGETP